MKMNLYGFKFNLETVIGSLLLGLLIGSSLFCSCSKVSVKEGMSLIGAALDYNLSSGVPGDTWTNKPDTKSDKSIYASLKNNKGGTVPLPNGEMNFFYANKFSPSCCYKPQQYSTGSGCACISVEQMKYLNERGGNNS